ncbi:MAG: hypothetical protein DRI83_09485 [Bacteroidetes bacterium]|nr:MAG: hypothetical protein DRI83_09485 [Bacteroidota bacterium]
MKKIAYSFIILLWSLSMFSQTIEFEQHIVSDTFTIGYDVSAADIDLDGKIDILACGKHNGGTVAWYRNEGSSSFTMSVLKEGFSGARSVRAADLNGDGDIDIVSAAWMINDIIYFVNDGNENFTEQMVDDDFKGAHTIDLKDVDEDGDLDILCSGFDYYGKNGEIAWWENDGADSISWTKQLISSRFQQSPFIFAEDMDNDGDKDVIACGELNNEILWWENNGAGVFISENMVDSPFYSAHTVIARDVDLDGDMDILGAGCMSSKLAWYENDGNQEFTKHSLPALGGDLWLDAFDLDADGDQDLIAAGMSSTQLKWFENNGSEQFTKRDIDGGFSSGFAIVPANMDSDGDIDLLAIGYASGTISWFENDLDSTTSIRQEIASGQIMLKVFPNPCKEQLSIYDIKGTAKVISIYSSSGELLRKMSSAGKETIINTGTLPKGLLIIETRFPDNSTQTTKVIRQ